MKIQTVFLLYSKETEQKHNRFTRATKPINYLELSVMRSVHEKNSQNSDRQKSLNKHFWRVN